VLSPDALTIGFARRFATYKRANLCWPTWSGWLDGERSQAPGAVSSLPARRIRTTSRASGAAADREMMRDSEFADKFRLRRGLRHQRGPLPGAGRGCVAEQSAAAAGGLGHQRQKVVLNGG
jgi:hypothetical protein